MDQWTSTGNGMTTKKDLVRLKVNSGSVTTTSMIWRNHHLLPRNPSSWSTCEWRENRYQSMSNTTHSKSLTKQANTFWRSTDYQGMKLANSMLWITTRTWSLVLSIQTTMLRAIIVLPYLAVDGGIEDARMFNWIVNTVSQKQTEKFIGIGKVLNQNLLKWKWEEKCNYFYDFYFHTITI